MMVMTVTMMMNVMTMTTSVGDDGGGDDDDDNDDEVVTLALVSIFSGGDSRRVFRLHTWSPRGVPLHGSRPRDARPAPQSAGESGPVSASSPPHCRPPHGLAQKASWCGRERLIRCGTYAW